MKTLYAVCKAFTWDCVELNSSINTHIEWKYDDFPDRFMPIFESREKAERVYPNENIMELIVE